MNCRHTAEQLEQIQRLAARRGQALLILEARGCDHYTTGVGSCWQYGRKAVADLQEKQACPARVAQQALGEN